MCGQFRWNQKIPTLHSNNKNPPKTKLLHGCDCLYCGCLCCGHLFSICLCCGFVHHGCLYRGCLGRIFCLFVVILVVVVFIVFVVVIFLWWWLVQKVYILPPPPKKNYQVYYQILKLETKQNTWAKIKSRIKFTYWMKIFMLISWIKAFFDYNYALI